MQLVERHLVKEDDPRFAVIDAAAFASKNLYNQANYQIRQAYIHQGKYVPYAGVFHLVKGMDCYKALPAKVANSILILLHKNWVSFFAALEAYKADPSAFTGRPKLPKYKDKGKGRNILIYDTQADVANVHSRKRANWSLRDYPSKLKPASRSGGRLPRCASCPRFVGI